MAVHDERGRRVILSEQEAPLIEGDCVTVYDEQGRRRIALDGDLGDLNIVVSDNPEDNEVLAYDSASGKWINQTAAEAGLQGTLTTGDLMASAPLQTSATRQVIGGGVTLSLDQSGIDHGSVGGLGDDDHAQYLLASGARAGSASQAQSFGATGIKADQIAEATADAGVTVDGVLLKDSGATFGADVNFATFKAVAMSCDRGTSFPASPAQGQWFYHTTGNCLFMYDGSAWEPIISFGAMTLYVDGTNGSDAPGQGFASGSGATATIQYAIDLIPAIVGGNVTVNIAAGTYSNSSSIVVSKRVFLGAYTITIQGAVTTVASGTITDFRRSGQSTGTGRVNTVAGGSTTVTLSGGGSTSAFWVGAVIRANGLSRTVTSIVDSTTFTVDTAVDWNGGGAGFAYAIWQSQIQDSAATWSDGQYNDKLLCTNTANPDANLVFILNTVASTKRLHCAGYMASAPTAGSTQYAIYTLATTIVFTTSSAYLSIFCDNVVLKYLAINCSSVSLTGVYALNVIGLAIYGVHVYNATSAAFHLLSSALDTHGIFVSSSNRGLNIYYSTGMAYIRRAYLKQTSSYNLFASRALMNLSGSYVETTNPSLYPLYVTDHAMVITEFSITRRISGYDIALYARRCGGCSLAGLWFLGFTSDYVLDTATYGFVA